VTKENIGLVSEELVTNYYTAKNSRIP